MPANVSEPLTVYREARKHRFALNRLLLANLELPIEKRSRQPIEFDDNEDPDTGEIKRMMRYVYMTSLPPAASQKNTGFREGQVCGMSLAHASRNMADGTHRVAADDEIEGWFAQQRTEFSTHTREDARRRAQKAAADQGMGLPNMPDHLIPVAVRSKPKAVEAVTA